MASSQWISNVANHTMASWYMIGNATLGVQCTDARTWILAFVIQTGQMTWAIAVYNTLWSTTTVRIAVIFGQAFACTSTVFLNAISVRTTRIYCTRM